MFNRFMFSSDLCYDMPDIKKGSHMYDVRSGIGKYQCYHGYYMPTLNVTHVYIWCNGSGHGDVTSLENCIGISMCMYGCFTHCNVCEASYRLYAAYFNFLYYYYYYYYYRYNTLKLINIQACVCLCVCVCLFVCLLV